jgi:hypothetical protein
MKLFWNFYSTKGEMNSIVEGLKYVGTFVIPKSHKESLLEPKVFKGRKCGKGRKARKASKPRYSLHKHNLALGKVPGFRKYQRLFPESPEFLPGAESDASGDDTVRDWYEIESDSEAGTGNDLPKETDSKVSKVSFKQLHLGRSIY